MQKLEAGGHVDVERSLLIVGSISGLGDHTHGQLLTSHLPYRSFNVNDGRRTEKALLTAVRFLSDGCVEAYDGGHWHDTGGIVGDVVAYDTANLGMGIILVMIFEFPLASGRLGII